MADYYLKTDNIMKNMFVVALKDELAAQSQRGRFTQRQKPCCRKSEPMSFPRKGFPLQVRNSGNFAMPSIGCGTSILPWAGTATALTA